VTKSKRIRRAGYVARLGDGGREHRVLMRAPEREPLEDPGVDRTKILKNGSSRSGIKAWIGLNWVRIGIGGGGALANAVTKLRIS
jgi:hypothetical protein